MNDPMGFDTFERRLASELARHADVARDLRPTAQVAAEAMRPRGLGASARARGRLIVVGLAAALLLPAFALLAGGQGTTEPDTGGASFSGVLLREVPDQGGREIDVVIAETGGRERTVRRLVVPGGGVYRGGGSVSPEGWLALPARVEGFPTHVLFDLGDPDPTPRLVPYMPIIGGAWGPGGLFATTCPAPKRMSQGRSPDGGVSKEGGALPPRDAWPCSDEGLDHVQVIDAATGEARVLEVDLPGGGPDIIWAADGSGLLTPDSTQMPPDGGTPPWDGGPPWGGGPPWAVVPLDGGPPEPGAPGMYSGWGKRWIAEGGATLDAIADLGPGESSSGPLDHVVKVWEAEGVTTTWYEAQLAPDLASDASLSADGRSVWLLLLGGRRQDRLVLAHLPSPGQIELISTTPIEPRATHAFFSWVAPDDSLFVVNVWHGDDVESPLMLIPTTDGPASEHTGHIAGFVPTSLADGWEEPTT